jgi:hypothetical protein
MARYDPRSAETVLGRRRHRNTALVLLYERPWSASYRRRSARLPRYSHRLHKPVRMHNETRRVRLLAQTPSDDPQCARRAHAGGAFEDSADVLRIAVRLAEDTP